MLTSSLANPHRWTGQRQDPATGLYLFPFRTFSPRLGQWLQRDPLLYVDSLNPYAYARHNPLRWTDPLGLQRPLDYPMENPAPNWPLPPGWEPGKWGWLPKTSPKPCPPADPGRWVDPDGKEWRWHADDEGHYEHWDKRDRHKKKREHVDREGRPIKPFKNPKNPEPSRRVPIEPNVPWYVDWFANTPDWIIPDPETADRIAAGTAAVGVGAAAGAAVLTFPPAAPVLAPAF